MAGAAKVPAVGGRSPNFPLYMRFSKMARRIYEDYSDYIEPFGLDENWLDVTGDDRTGEQIAQEIRRRVKAELGITVSVGVSFNKIFAKLGSDYKKAGRGDGYQSGKLPPGGVAPAVQ